MLLKNGCNGEELKEENLSVLKNQKIIYILAYYQKLASVTSCTNAIHGFFMPRGERAISISFMRWRSLAAAISRAVMRNKNHKPIQLMKGLL